jgi:hypothetical protein
MAIRLSRKETSQWMRKLAKQKFRGAAWTDTQVSGRRPGIMRKLTDQDSGYSSPAATEKPPRMPSDSFRATCPCGLGIMIWCGPAGLGPAEKRFMVEWRERHSKC